MAFSTDADLIDAYRRHPERDQEAFLGLRSAGASIRIPPASGTFVSVPVAPPPSHGQRTSPGGIGGVVSSGNAAIRAEVEATLTGPHLRNVVVNDNAPVNATYGDLGLVPMDAPAGTLCGVIIKGGLRYYIWRKTAENRRTFDYERRAMQIAANQDILAGLD